MVYKVRWPDEDFMLFFIHSRVEPASALDSDSVKKYLQTLSGDLQHETFDDMTETLRRIYMVEVPLTDYDLPKNWRELVCNCPASLKAKSCYHTLGLGIRLGLLNEEDVKKLPLDHR